MTSRKNSRTSRSSGRAKNIEAVEVQSVETVEPAEAVEAVEDIETPVEAVAEAIEEAPKKNNKATIVSEASDKMVLCRGLEEHECSIGGVKYIIKKDSDIKLPNSIATILSHSRVVVKR